MANAELIEQTNKALKDLTMAFPFEVKTSPYEASKEIGDQGDVLTASAGNTTGIKRVLSPITDDLDGAWKITTIEARPKNFSGYGKEVSDATHYVVETSKDFDSFVPAASKFILAAEDARLTLDDDFAQLAGVDWSYVAPSDYDRPDFVEADEPQVDFRAVEGTFARTTVLNRNLGSSVMVL